MKFTIYAADVTGVQDNCVYPHRYEPDGPDALRRVIRKDHVCATYKNNYRGKANFISSDCLVMDVDNDHSENPEEWITPEHLAVEYEGIRYAITYSRNNMRQKGQYGPRPRYHIYFWIEPVTDYEQYGDMKAALYAMYPFYDDNCLDAGRFIYGSESEEVIWHDGDRSILSLIATDDIVPLIPEGNRNKTMHQWAVSNLKRDGNTDELRERFYQEAARCVPPLDDQELQTIWRSATRFYENVVKKDPEYVDPREFKTGIPAKWEAPIPFGRYDLEPFPTDALPPDIGEYVEAVAESTQTPVDMAGTAALTLVSVCAQGKYVIRGKADWIEPLNTFSNIIASPSERKSAVLHAVVSPADNYEVQYNLRNAGRVESSKMRKRVLERRQKAVEDKVAKGNAEEGELERIAQEIAEFEDEKPLHLYVDDITTEKLVSVMASNRGRAALISSEGGIFDTLAGIYTKNVNIDVMLKGYSGDTIRVDRIGRESESIMNPSLTILLMTQPKVVSDVLSNATFRGRGLTARFLYCLPASSVGDRRFQSTPVPDAVYRRYEQKIVNMLEEEYPGKPAVISLSPEASELLTAFAEEIEPRLKTDYAEIADWAGKLVGNTLRIAGLLCRAGVYRAPEFLNDDDALVVDGATMANAIRLGRYYLSHALAVYDVIPEATMHRQAERILQMIRENNLTEFNRRMAMRCCRSFKTVAEIQPVLDFLDDYGYIIRKPDKAVTSGRPPLPKYAVNPAVLS